MDSLALENFHSLRQHHAVPHSFHATAEDASDSVIPAANATKARRLVDPISEYRRRRPLLRAVPTTGRETASNRRQRQWSEAAAPRLPCRGWPNREGRVQWVAAADLDTSRDKVHPLFSAGPSQLSGGRACDWPAQTETPPPPPTTHTAEDGMGVAPCRWTACRNGGPPRPDAGTAGAALLHTEGWREAMRKRSRDRGRGGGRWGEKGSSANGPNAAPEVLAPEPKRRGRPPHSGGRGCLPQRTPRWPPSRRRRQWRGRKWPQQWWRQRGRRHAAATKAATQSSAVPRGGHDNHGADAAQRGARPTAPYASG